MNREEYLALSEEREKEAKGLALKALDGQLPPGYVWSDSPDQMYGNAMFRIKPESVVPGSISIHFLHRLKHRTDRVNGDLITTPTTETVTAHCDIFNGHAWETNSEWGIDGKVMSTLLSQADLAFAVRDAVSMALSQKPFVSFEWKRDEHDSHKHHLFAGTEKFGSVWKSGNMWGTTIGIPCETLGNAKVRTEGAAMGMIKTRHDERLAGLGDKDMDKKVNVGTVVTWNTGRQYSGEGQRLSAVVLPSTGQVAFLDLDRMIDGVTTTAINSASPDEQRIQQFVMSEYDHGRYNSGFYGTSSVGKDHEAVLEFEIALKDAAKTQGKSIHVVLSSIEGDTPVRPGVDPYDRNDMDAAIEYSKETKRLFQSGDMDAAFAHYMRDPLGGSTISFKDTNKDEFVVGMQRMAGGPLAATYLTPNERQAWCEAGAGDDEIEAIAKMGGYEVIRQSAPKLLSLQDLLDHVFEARYLGVRNELRKMGWEGEGQALEKTVGDASLRAKLVCVNAGAGRNVVDFQFDVVDVSKPACAPRIIGNDMNKCIMAMATEVDSAFPVIEVQASVAAPGEALRTGPSFNIGQRFEFKVGDPIVGNGYRGSVTKVCDGQLAGMVEVRLPGGCGEKVDIQYRGDKAVVVEPKAKGKGNGR